MDELADSWALLFPSCSWHNFGVNCVGGVPVNFEARSLQYIHGVAACKYKDEQADA